MEEINLLKKQFEQHSNQERAQSMSAYMKGLFPFFGIMSGPRKELVKKWINEYQLKKDPTKSKALIRKLFSEKERELHYAGIDLMLSLPQKQIEREDKELIEYLIVTHAWWDSVDLIASNYLGPYLQKFPEEKALLVTTWRNSDHLWLKRSCLIFQLKYRLATDRELLQDLIHQMKVENEFFIRKAIGWALREYSKHDPSWVRKIIDTEKLEGLSKREASKYI